MRKLFLFLLIIVFANNKSATAQITEAGLQIGEMHYIGDLTAGKFGDANQIHVAYGGFIRNSFANGIISMRAGILLGKISGNDNNFDPSSSLYHRHLNFESYVQDFNFMVDVNLPGLSPCKYKFFSPYISAGVSIFHFNPIAEYFGQTVNLQELGTEGQGIAQFGNRAKYSLFQPSFPVGLGVKNLARDIFIVSLEVMYHITMTDYLDDVSTNYYDPQIIKQYNGAAAAYLSNRSDYKVVYDSKGLGSKQRGNSQANDAFIVSSISLSYIIDQRCGRAYKGLDFRQGGASKCASEF